jgi:hypothetical protein
MIEEIEGPESQSGILAIRKFNLNDKFANLLFLRDDTHVSVVDLSRKICYRLLKVPWEQLIFIEPQFELSLSLDGESIQLVALEYLLQKSSAVRSFEFSIESLYSLLEADDKA